MRIKYVKYDKVSEQQDTSSYVHIYIFLLLEKL